VYVHVYAYLYLCAYIHPYILVQVFSMYMYMYMYRSTIVLRVIESTYLCLANLNVTLFLKTIAGASS